MRTYKQYQVYVHTKLYYSARVCIKGSSTTKHKMCSSRSLLCTTPQYIFIALQILISKGTTYTAFALVL